MLLWHYFCLWLYEHQTHGIVMERLLNMEHLNSRICRINFSMEWKVRTYRLNDFSVLRNVNKSKMSAEVFWMKHIRPNLIHNTEHWLNCSFAICQQPQRVDFFPKVLEIDIRSSPQKLNAQLQEWANCHSRWAPLGPADCTFGPLRKSQGEQDPPLRKHTTGCLKGGRGDSRVRGPETFWPPSDEEGTQTQQSDCHGGKWEDDHSEEQTEWNGPLACKNWTRRIESGSFAFRPAYGWIAHTIHWDTIRPQVHKEPTRAWFSPLPVCIACIQHIKKYNKAYNEG